MIPVSVKDKPCTRPVGVFAGIQVGSSVIIAGNMRCNSWTCPTCQPILKKKLYRRIYRGALSADAVPRYGLKFLTLTYPGMASRAGRLASEIYVEMADAFHKLVRALKKFYGTFHYFRVCELQKDGTPHFHILLAGKNIVPKSFLNHCKKLWSDTYGMGFIKLNSIPFTSQKHAISYMLKYITKDITKPGRKKRIFTASRGALVKTEKKQWKKITVYMGCVDERGVTEWDITEEIQKHGIYDCVRPGGGRIIDKLDYEDRLLELITNRYKIREYKTND